MGSPPCSDAQRHHYSEQEKMEGIGWILYYSPTQGKNILVCLASCPLHVEGEITKKQIYIGHVISAKQVTFLVRN